MVTRKTGTGRGICVGDPVRMVSRMDVMNKEKITT